MFFKLEWFPLRYPLFSCERPGAGGNVVKFDGNRVPPSYRALATVTTRSFHSRPPWPAFNCSDYSVQKSLVRAISVNRDNKYAVRSDLR